MNGSKVRSKKNGNFIFVPAVGYRFGSPPYTGSGGYCWSSSPSVSSADRACELYFDSGNFFWSSRSYGLTVRPVAEP